MILVDTKKRRADIYLSVEPSDKYHGKTWYDLANEQLKFWDAYNQEWVSEIDLELIIIDADTL